MPFFIVTMTHPDGDGWGQHVGAHVSYLKQLVNDGVLKASGPLKGTPKRAGHLIMQAANRAGVEKAVADDPFAEAGLIDRLEITEWDPLFGTFAGESSGQLAGLDGPL